MMGAVRGAHSFAKNANEWGTLYNRVGVVKRHVDRRKVWTFPFVEGFGVALGVAFCSCDHGPLSESCGGSLVPPTIYPVTDFRP
jgi:hypothetical protein